MNPSYTFCRLRICQLHYYNSSVIGRSKAIYSLGLIFGLYNMIQKWVTITLNYKFKLCNPKIKKVKVLEILWIQKQVCNTSLLRILWLRKIYNLINNKRMKSIQRFMHGVTIHMASSDLVKILFQISFLSFVHIKLLLIKFHVGLNTQFSLLVSYSVLICRWKSVFCYGR